MPKIEFIRDTTSLEGGSDRPKKGDVLDVGDDSAARWIRRGAAILSPVKAAKTPAKTTKTKKPPTKTKKGS